MVLYLQYNKKKTKLMMNPKRYKIQKFIRSGRPRREEYAIYRELYSLLDMLPQSFTLKAHSFVGMKNAFTVEQLAIIAKYFGCEIDDLLDNDDARAELKAKKEKLEADLNALSGLNV